MSEENENKEIKKHEAKNEEVGMQNKDDAEESASKEMGSPDDGVISKPIESESAQRKGSLVEENADNRLQKSNKEVTSPKPVSSRNVPEDQRLDLYIEALIFAAEYALNIEEIRKVVNVTFGQNFKKQHVQELIDNIRDKYEDDDLAIQLIGIAGGYLFMTKPKYHRIIGDFLKLSSKRKLSKAAMETLSIIAYKQPISKTEIESIRGVNADYAVQKLLEKEMVEITGRADGPGRPLLYGTSLKFLNHFGIEGTADLPKLKEFETPEDTIGVSEEE